MAQDTIVQPTDDGGSLVVSETDLTDLTSENAEQAVIDRVEAAIQRYEVDPESISAEIAEVRDWWDVAAFGPVQRLRPGGPVLPHRVIKVGERASVFAIIVLNPRQALPTGTNAADVLANFGLPFEVQFQTGNLTTWTLAPPDMQAVRRSNFVPGRRVYVQRITFTGREPGLYEMNISARILGAAPPFQNAPQFAGYATTVLGLDAADLFGTRPNGPLRFQVYP